MSKQKIRSNSFNCLVCGVAKEKKVFAATWSFNKSVEISSAVERMLLPGGYLKKNR